MHVTKGRFWLLFVKKKWLFVENRLKYEYVFCIMGKDLHWECNPREF